MLVRQIMSTNVVTVEMDDTLKTVQTIFENLKFHHLLVLDGGKLVGVISDRDLLKAISPNIGTNIESYRDAATLNKKVHQIMTRKPVTLNQQASVASAIEVFNCNRISCLPVVNDDSRLVGILSWRDILKNLQARPDPVAT